MKQPLHILHVEDSPYDSELIRYQLRKNGMDCEIHRVENREQLFEKLEKAEYDLILADYTLPEFSGLQALEIAHALRPQVPFIFVSGTIGEETAIESLQNGATDYVLKHRLTRLIPAVRRALAEAHEKTMLRAMKGRLRQSRRLEAIGTLAGGLAHDFNNLLQIFKSHLTLLPLEADRPDRVVKIAQTLNQAADQASELMQELLVFARKTNARFTQVNITEFINNLAEVLKAGLPPDVNLVLQLDEGLPAIFADPGQMSRIVTNLVKNAKEAMSKGGCITISAEIVGVDPEPMDAWHLDEPLYLCLKVSDTGRGMDEDAMLHAFEPFFTTKALEKGTGLGLAIVFGLMQVHNGLIKLQSEVGKGTAVSLFFPLPQGSIVDPEMVKKIPSFQLLGDAVDVEAVPA